jgi:hypothetical protein
MEGVDPLVAMRSLIQESYPQGKITGINPILKEIK